jgi:hypothetical protein
MVGVEKDEGVSNLGVRRKVYPFVLESKKERELCQAS